MRIRTINMAVRDLKAMDPACAVSASLLRRLCKSGELAYIPNGNRMLVDLDDVISYFSQTIRKEGSDGKTL